jgi:hypothetical protein
LFEKIVYLPLETLEESLLTNIDKIEFYNKRFYILDKTSKELIAFSENGLFVNKLSKYGNGPGEYNEISSFAINYDNEDIIIIDNVKREILFYNPQFEYIKSLDLNVYGSACIYNNGYIILYSDNKYPEKYNLHFISINTGIVEKSILPINKRLRDFQSKSGGQFMRNYNGELYFKESLYRDVIMIRNLNVSNYLQLNFSPYNIPSDYFERNTDLSKLLFELNNGTYAAYPTVPIESEKYLYFNYVYNFRKKTVIVNKENESLINGDIQNDIDLFGFIPPTFGVCDTLYSFAYAYEFSERIQLLEKNNFDFMNEIDQNISNLGAIVKKIEIMDNPIIIKYVYK